MKLSDAKKYLPFVQAAAEGKTIQRRNGDGSWVDFDPLSDVTFAAEVDSYRIKPKPKLRPWAPEEVPVGAIVHYKSIQNLVACELITQKDSSGNVRLCDGEGGVVWFAPQNLLNLYTHSIDGGKTWLPCGVEDAQ